MGSRAAEWIVHTASGLTLCCMERSVGGCNDTVEEGGLQLSHLHEIETFDLRLVRPTLQQSKKGVCGPRRPKESFQHGLCKCTHYSALQEQGESHIDMGPLSGSGFRGKV